MMNLISGLTGELKDIKNLLNEKGVTDEEIATRFPMFNTFNSIPDGMLENPLVQSIINNIHPK